MKFLNNKEITKRIIIAILIVMSFNFISPLTSNAGADEAGGKLFQPISLLLRTVTDLLVMGMQKIFLGNGYIENRESLCISHCF